MTLESFIRTYGYAAVLVGTFFEGETILILAALAAHLGYLQLHWVILAGAVGSFSGDQVLFLLGRIQGPSLLSRHPDWAPRVNQIHTLLERYRLLLIPLSRWFYGLRYPVPFAFGSSNLSAPLYVLMDAVSVLFWALVVGGAGYFFGHALEIFLGDLRYYEFILLAGVATLGLIIRARQFYRRRHAKPKRS